MFLNSSYRRCHIVACQLFLSRLCMSSILQYISLNRYSRGKSVLRLLCTHSRDLYAPCTRSIFYHAHKRNYNFYSVHVFSVLCVEMRVCPQCRLWNLGLPCWHLGVTYLCVAVCLLLLAFVYYCTCINIVNTCFTAVRHWYDF